MSKCSIENKEMYNFKDLTGMKFGLWTVLELDKERNKEIDGTYWICQCDCENKTIKSVSASHLVSGKTLSCGCRWKTATAGENNYNWKGGVTPENQKERHKFAARKWSKDILSKDYYTCQCCGITGSFLNAHHIYNFADYKDKRLDIDNGICLCDKCHSISFKESFHNIYGTKNNTPEQLEEYINNKRAKLNINIKFSIKDYINRINILKPAKEKVV